MALKIGFVDGNVFHAHDALQTLHFHHGVHEQKRVAMRQNLLNLHNIHDHFAVSVAAHPLGSDWQESRENSNYKRTAALAIRALPRRGPQRQDRRASAGARHSTLPCLEAAASMAAAGQRDRKSTRLNSSYTVISYAVFCLKKKKNKNIKNYIRDNRGFTHNMT